VALGAAHFILRRGDLPAAVREDVEHIKKAAERTAAVTQQLLAFSRRQLLRPQPLDLNSVVEGFEPVLRRTVGEGVELRLALAPDLGPVSADPGQLEQVLLNLALNARDAMPGGGVLQVETANVVLDETSAADRGVTVRPGGYAALVVRDTGHGMDPNTLRQIFEPFFTTKGVGKGTGLGLSTVYGIVKQSGGYIFADSEPGRGTTVTIYLPLADAERPAPPPPAGRPHGGGETILVVEDDALVRAIMTRGLEEAGYAVLEAEHGDAALELARDGGGPLDLVVTDLAMPGVGGRELAEWLAELRPDVPVLFVSGHTDDDVVRRGLLDPGVAYLQKPFTPEVLARRVREMLDARPRGPGPA
jgi:two-component system cell cycle sensor histidine kinase/response regulator CckA